MAEDWEIVLELVVVSMCCVGWMVDREADLTIRHMETDFQQILHVLIHRFLKWMDLDSKMHFEWEISQEKHRVSTGIQVCELCKAVAMGSKGSQKSLTWSNWAWFEIFFERERGELRWVWACGL